MMQPTIKRKTILVSIYYRGEHEPKTDKWDDQDVDIDAPVPDDVLFLNDSIEATMRQYNPQSDIFDVAIDETKSFLDNVNSLLSARIRRLLRKSY